MHRKGALFGEILVKGVQKDEKQQHSNERMGDVILFQCIPRGVIDNIIKIMHFKYAYRKELENIGFPKLETQAFLIWGF
jgi:hypothetical protein